MRKSLAIIASALLLAVGASSHERLRYDSSVFASSDVSGARAKRVEYPPCVRGVREDRCIQLYERGVRRNYQNWLVANGRGGERIADAGPRRGRAYRACRGRQDDRCQQRATRQARAVRRAPTRAAQRRAVAARPTRVARATAAPRQRPSTRSTTPRRPISGGTPGI